MSGPNELRELAKELAYEGNVPDRLNHAADAWQKDLDDWKDDADTLHSIAEDLNALRKRLEAAEKDAADAEHRYQSLLEASVPLRDARDRLIDRLEIADNAMRQALSDLEWIERQVPGSNLQSSILLLRHALGKEEKK